MLYMNDMMQMEYYLNHFNSRIIYFNYMQILYLSQNNYVNLMIVREFAKNFQSKIFTIYVQIFKG